MRFNVGSRTGAASPVPPSGNSGVTAGTATPGTRPTVGEGCMKLGCLPLGVDISLP